MKERFLQSPPQDARAESSSNFLVEMAGLINSEKGRPIVSKVTRLEELFNEASQLSKEIPEQSNWQALRDGLYYAGIWFKDLSDYAKKQRKVYSLYKETAGIASDFCAQCRAYGIELNGDDADGSRSLLIAIQALESNLNNPPNLIAMMESSPSKAILARITLIQTYFRIIISTMSELIIDHLERKAQGKA